MNLWEFLLGAILIGTIGSIIKSFFDSRRARPDGHDAGAGGDTGTRADNGRLHDEIRTLRDRVQVLERVVTDQESGARLDREIEKLRDKNRV